jgi:hypothetical protein
VSLLERVGRGHLSDRRIARLWTSGVGHPHLDGCTACRARYDAFDRWAVGIADDLRAEAEDTMSAEQYALQQAQIARRLEVLDRPGRVIAFPKAARAIIGGHSHVGRWIAAAAAAGLIAGVGLDQIVPELFGTTAHVPPAVIQSEMTTSRANGRPNSIKPASATFDETQFLSDTFVDSRVKDLRAIDDLTPHVRDIVAAK